jgi:hypothetical protein
VTYVLLVLTLAAVAGVSVGLVGLLGRLPARSLGGVHSGAPVLVLGSVAAVMAGLAFLPFALADKLSDGLLTGVVIGIAVVLAASAGAAWLAGSAMAKGRDSSHLGSP